MSEPENETKVTGESIFTYVMRGIGVRVCVTLSIACVILVFLFASVEMFHPLAGPVNLLRTVDIMGNVLGVVELVILVPMILSFWILPHRVTAVLTALGVVGWVTLGLWLVATPT